ncbi:MAG: hypothetical protein KatS3mg108_0870 [Isosphaeraceae bacterium]|jgi:hypothetical protein|nr:MAG: hypothetical protein KatS3mg108_0870 [Isosphaeraceae bacterium]
MRSWLLSAPVFALAGALVVAGSTTPAWAQRPRVIVGPGTVYQRGYSPSFAASAGFSYQAGQAAPVILPNYSTVPSLTPTGAPRPVPYLATPGLGYVNNYPGYGFGFGNAYGYNWGYGYGGYTFGYGAAWPLASSLPPSGYYVYPRPRVLINSGYYRR